MNTKTASRGIFLFILSLLLLAGLNAASAEPITAIELGTEQLMLEVGETYTFSVSYVPEKPLFPALSWFVSDETVIAVDPVNFSVTALAPGSARIYAESFDGHSRTECEVIVSGSGAKDAYETKSGSSLIHLTQADRAKIAAPRFLGFLEYVESSEFHPRSLQKAAEQPFEVLAAVQPGTEEAQSRLALSLGMEKASPLKYIQCVSLIGTFDQLVSYVSDNPDLIAIFGGESVLHPIPTETEMDAGQSETLAKSVNFGDYSNEITEVDIAHQLGFTGKGVTIAVLDSGLNKDHEQFAGRVIKEYCLSPNGSLGTSPVCVEGSSAPSLSRRPREFNHGSHVTGIAAGRDGMAPGADIISVEIYTERQWQCGSSDPESMHTDDYETTGMCSALSETAIDLFTAFNQLLQWIDEGLEIDIINFSSAFFDYSSGTCDSFSTADYGIQSIIYNQMHRVLQDIANAGILTVVCAGNEEKNGEIAIPACDSNVVAAGAAFYYPGPPLMISHYSNHSSRIDLLAPGTYMNSALYAFEVADAVGTCEDADDVNGRKNCYGRYTGTSMSTPMIAGTFALLKEALPEKSNAELRQLIRDMSEKSANKKSVWYFDAGTNGMQFDFDTPVLNFAKFTDYLPAAELTWDFETVPYDGQVHKPVVISAVDANGHDYTDILNFTYTYTKNGEPVDAPTDAGEYAVTAAVTNEHAPAVANFTHTFTITPREGVTVTVTGHTATETYDGNPHRVEGHDISISDPLYTAADFTYTGRTYVTRTVAGTTCMEIAPEQFTNKNKNFIDVQFIITDGCLTIAPMSGVTVTITGKNSTLPYDRNSHGVQGFDAAYSTDLYKRNDFHYSGNHEARRTDAGTTQMGLTAADFENVNPNFTDVVFAVTDGYQTITPIEETMTVTVIGKNSTLPYDGSAHSVTGYTYEADHSLYRRSDWEFSGTSRATQKDAGTAQMGMKPEQFTNLNENFSNVVFDVTDGFQTIEPLSGVTVTITGKNNTRTYDGNPHSVSGYSFEADNRLYKQTDFRFSGTAEASRTDAGTVFMGLSPEQFSNESPNFTNVVFAVTDGFQTIEPLSGVTVTITGNTRTLPYDRSEHRVEGYKTSFSSKLYTEEDFSFSGTAAAARTDAGTTEMGLKAEQFENTNGNFSDVTFTVRDGYQTITPVPAVTVTITGNTDSVPFDGSEHSVSGYTFSTDNDLYKEADFSFSGSAVAKQTDTGTAYMGLTAAQFSNENHNFTTVKFNVTDGSITVTKLPAVTVTITGHTDTAEYDGTEYSIEGYDVSIDTDLYKEADFSFSGTAEAKRTDAGTAPMGLTPAQFTNINPSFETVNFIVTDGFITVTPLSGVTVTITGHTDTAEYDGTEHSVEGYDVSIDTDLYKEADFSFSGTAEAKQTDAGTASMGLAPEQFRSTNPNFEDVTFAVTDGSVTVTKVPEVNVSITGHTDTAEYDGTEHSVSGYDVSIDNDLYKEADISFSGTAEARQTDAGTAPMGLTPAQFSNQNPNFETVNFSITDGFLTVTQLSGVTVTITGHTDSAEYDGTEHSVSGYDVSINKDLYKESDFSFSGTAEAKQTDAGTALMGLVPEQFTNQNPNVGTVSFAVTDGFVTVTKVPEVNVTITGHTVNAEYDGKEHSVSGYDVSIDHSVYQEADFSFSGSAEAKQTEAGTASMGLNAGQFINENSSFETVNFIITDGSVTVAPRTAALKWAPTEFIYDGDPHLPAASVTNLVDGDSCAVTVTGEQTRAGVHTAEAVSLDNANYILPADPTVTFTIGKKTAEIRWENTEFTYDGAPHVPTAVVSNLQEGQECTVSVEGAQVNASAEGEPYTAVVTGLSNDNYVLPEEPVTTTFIIKKAPIIEGSEFTAPRAVPGLPFDGESHPLILPGSWTGEAEGTFLYRLAGYAPKAPDAEDFSEALPEGTDSGVYTVEWMIRGDGNHLDLGPESLSASIDQKTIEPQMIEISPTGFAFDGETHSVTFTLRDGERELTEGTDYVLESAELSGSEPGLYAIRVRGTGNYTGSAENTWVIGQLEIRGADSVTTGSSAAQELFMDQELQGAVITWSVDNPAQLSLNAISGQETLVTGIRAGRAFLTATITTPEGTYTLRKEIRVDYEMFETTPGLNRLWDPERDLPSFADHANLPATGFPVNSGMPKAVRERAVPYTDLKMRIQIPSIDVDAELAGVPATDEVWLVEDLGDKAGLLSGTSLPGEGYAIVAGHNHLNDAQSGPFLLIRDLRENDVIFVNTPENELLRFSVYANELMDPDDMQRLAGIAEQEENTLVLVTCENEAAEGGYLNRRVVFAKPL